MGEDTDEQLQKICETPTQKLPMVLTNTQIQKPLRRRELHEENHNISLHLMLLLTSVVLTGIVLLAFSPLFAQIPAIHHQAANQQTHKPIITQPVFNPDLGAILPTHRIVAFYAIPNAPTTGPAYELTPSMLASLRTQAEAYQRLDPAHPVQPGIDLVASIPDNFPGPEGTFSHHLDASTIQAYINFCQQNDLVLFLDLDFGWASIQSEVNFFLPYLERYPFVQMAIDPEWMFPRHNGIPGTDLSNARASDLNPVIEALAGIPIKYHVPRKILLIHQYRGDGDGLKNPYSAELAEIADKQDLLNDPRVDVVIHVDSVGGFVGDQAEKTRQYDTWVGKDMQKYHNFRYGGFKMFYHIEAKTLMTPRQVLALKPPPMVVTYGN
ncbi:MAG TPA: hypothetical protein VGM01_08420 [Ktedonobacteraceae bacterium]|jgi:hypothetical protein